MLTDPAVLIADMTGLQVQTGDVLDATGERVLLDFVTSGGADITEPRSYFHALHYVPPGITEADQPQYIHQEFILGDADWSDPYSLDLRPTCERCIGCWMGRP